MFLLLKSRGSCLLPLPGPRVSEAGAFRTCGCSSLSPFPVCILYQSSLSLRPPSRLSPATQPHEVEPQPCSSPASPSCL